MTYPPLFPTKPNSHRPHPTFGVVDIEASRWINFLIIGYYGKEYKTYREGKKFIKQIYQGDRYETFEGPNGMGEWAEWMFEADQVHDTIFAHFGGKYDFQFILKEYFERRDRYYIDGMIPRGSGLLCATVSSIKRSQTLPEEKKFIAKLKSGEFLEKDRSITFKDSSALLPFGLATLTEYFAATHLKGEIDFETMIEVTPEIRKYLKHDCIGLHEVLEKFYQWPMIRAAGFSTTMASQSVKVWQNFLKKPIRSLTDDNDRFVRSSYIGGRTEIFKPLFRRKNKDLKVFDVNSLYPYCMWANEFPVAFTKSVNRFVPDRMGFYDVEVDVPEMYVPPLGTVFDPTRWCRLIFPTGKFRGFWSSVELEYAMSLGVKIDKVHEGRLFRSGGFIFKDYIQCLYDIREKARQEKNLVDNIMSKNLMNCTYGRTGLNRNRESVDFDYGQPGVRPYWDLAPESEEMVRLVTDDITLDNTFVNVAIAAWVTSHSRIHMHKQFMLAPEELYNTDTDSLFTTHEYERNDTELGKLKFEYAETEAACFLLPKTYLIQSFKEQWDDIDRRTGKKLKDKDGNTVKTNKKIVMKGFDKRKIRDFTMEDFEESLKGEIGILKTTNPEKFATFKTALNDGKFLKLLKESPREIRARYDKRRIVKGGAQGYDTEALHIKDGVIVNKTTDLPYNAGRFHEKDDFED